MRQLIVISGLMLVSASVFAKDSIKYACTLNDAERVIEVVYATDEATPCDVTYTKEGETKTLWHYEGTQGACETKAVEFVEKQASWGWNCGDAPAAAEKTEAAETPAAE